MDLLAGLLTAALAPFAPLGAFPMDRERLLHGLVGGGGAMLLAYAAWAHAHARLTVAQLRGLVAAGLGFLLSAWASMALRDRGVSGMAVSLLGSALVLWGARTLVRERQQARVASERRRSG